MQPILPFFSLAVGLEKGDYSDPSDAGEVSLFQALATALSGPIGLGNIAVIAAAVGIGRPGVSFWVILAALLGMESCFRRGVSSSEIFRTTAAISKLRVALLVWSAWKQFVANLMTEKPAGSLTHFSYILRGYLPSKWKQSNRLLGF